MKLAMDSQKNPDEEKSEQYFNPVKAMNDRLNEPGTKRISDLRHAIPKKQNQFF